VPIQPLPESLQLHLWNCKCSSLSIPFRSFMDYGFLPFRFNLIPPLSFLLSHRYPMLETIQKYLWPRLCKLDQQTLWVTRPARAHTLNMEAFAQNSENCIKESNNELNNELSLMILQKHWLLLALKQLRFHYRN
jgi:hypothetical protein